MSVDIYLKELEKVLAELARLRAELERVERERDAAELAVLRLGRRLAEHAWPGSHIAKALRAEFGPDPCYTLAHKDEFAVPWLRHLLAAAPIEPRHTGATRGDAGDCPADAGDCVP